MSCNSEYAVVWHGWAQLHTLYIFAILSGLAAPVRSNCRTSIDQNVAANVQIVVQIAPNFTLLTLRGEMLEDPGYSRSESLCHLFLHVQYPG